MRYLCQINMINAKTKDQTTQTKNVYIHTHIRIHAMLYVENIVINVYIVIYIEKTTSTDTQNSRSNKP